MTALSKKSKDSTAFLCEPNGTGVAALAVDIGQERTNLTNNTTYVSESASARTAVGAPREVSIVVDLASGSTGTLIYHGNNVSFGYRVRVVSGSIEVAEGGVTRMSLALPGVAVSNRKYLVSWSTRPDPGGGSNISDLVLYNFVLATWSVATATHGISAPTATDTLVIGAAFGGTSAFSGGAAAFHVVRVGRRYCSGTEVSEDMVAETVPPVMTARRRKALPTGASSELLTVSQGQFAGPGYLHALAATRAADSRCVTPLVNVRPKTPYAETNAYAPVRYFRSAWDSSVYHLSTRYLFHAIASPKTNHAWVRINVRAYNSLGPSIATIYFRMYSVAGLPVGQGQTPLTYFKTATATVSATTSTTGLWVDLGAVRLAKEASGLTYLALAFSIGLDSGAALENTTVFQVNAVTVEPFYKVLSSPGNGDLEG